MTVSKITVILMLLVDDVGRLVHGRGRIQENYDKYGKWCDALNIQ